MPKQPHLRKVFDGERLMIDNKSFVECEFRNCTLVYSGGPSPDFVECNLDTLQLEFEGPALRSVQFLSDVYDGFGEVGKKVVEATFDNIRRG